jgi:hypothetical protein
VRIETLSSEEVGDEAAALPDLAHHDHRLVPKELLPPRPYLTDGKVDRALDVSGLVFLGFTDVDEEGSAGESASLNWQHPCILLL